MYWSLKGIMHSAAVLGLAALILAPAAGAQRAAGAGQKPATTKDKPATTAEKPTTTADKPTTTAAPKAAPKAPTRTNKWVFGAHTIAAPGVSISGPDFGDAPINTTFGGGLGVMAGYELNRAVTAFASLDVAKQNSGVYWMEGSFGLVHAELGVRVELSQNNPQSVPYLLAAIGRRAIGSRVYNFDDDEVYDVSFTGMMASLGGGLQYTLSPKFSLDGGVEFGIGTFDHYDVDGDIGTVSANTSTSIRVRAGVVWRP